MMHLDAGDITVRPEHFVLVQEEVDVETVQAMRPTTLVLHVLLELQNEALFKLLAVRASERRRGRAPAPAPAWWGSSVYISQKKTSPSASASLSSKKEIGGLCALFPKQCFRCSTFHLSLLWNLRWNGWIWWLGRLMSHFKDAKYLLYACSDRSLVYKTWSNSSMIDKSNTIKFHEKQE